MPALIIEHIDWNDLFTLSPKTPEDAHVIGDVFDACLYSITDVVRRENQLLMQGAVEEALALLDQKTRISIDYTRASDLMRRNLVALTRLIPSRMPDLKDRQMALMAELQTNAKLISMIRSLSETLLRNVAKDANAASQVSTYGKNGKPTAPTLRNPSKAIIVSTSM